ncbi:hypothetical protein ACVWZR_000369 [Bradyrhizobium sp. i1.3.1]
MYRCLENLYTVFIPDPDVVARLREGWLLTAYAMSDELGVLLRLAAGRTLMSHLSQAVNAPARSKQSFLRRVPMGRLLISGRPSCLPTNA